KSGMLPADKKLLYVRLLVHFIGDMHQPMHTARKDDQGGNKVKVLWFNTPSNLHQVWDEKLVEFQELSYTEYAAAINFTSKQQRDALYKQPISEWMWNSYTLAEKIYADIKQPDQKLDYKYNYNYVAILNKQLLEAGVHLAGVLNDIFK
ncbi:MAG: S1/P1 Nuclease, partial [Pedobacter sp.]